MSLKALRQIFDKKDFPIEILNDIDSAACFFSVKFLGKNDVKYIYEAGIKDVVLIDIDEDMMDQMKEIYPPNWEYIVGDAWEIAKDLNGRMFDLVVCDSWTNQVSEVLGALDLFLKITRKVIVITVTQEHLADLMGGELRKRSNKKGGTYWWILKV